MKERLGQIWQALCALRKLWQADRPAALPKRRDWFVKQIRKKKVKA